MTCLRCNQKDRLKGPLVFDTDFGGKLTVWICRRCGTAQIETEGERPPDQWDARELPPIVLVEAEEL